MGAGGGGERGCSAGLTIFFIQREEQRNYITGMQSKYCFMKLESMD